jgi:hypothetical protein
LRCWRSGSALDAPLTIAWTMVHLAPKPGLYVAAAPTAAVAHSSAPLVASAAAKLLFHRT